MRAVMVDKFGPLEETSVREVASPEPKSNQILIESRYAGVNFPDLLMINGAYQVKPELPFSPGMEVSGIVIEVGDEVKDFSPGDRVAAHVGHGAYSELAVASASSCYTIPDDIPFEHAAALGLVYQTAHFALTERAHVSGGERVLILGAAGGVGTATIQLVKAYGAIAFAGVRHQDQHDVVRAAGADHVIDLSVKAIEENLRTQIHAITNGHGVDIVIDPVGGEMFNAGLRSLAWGGRLVVVGFASGELPTVKANYLLLKNLSVIGLHWGDYLRKQSQWVRRVQHDLYSLYGKGKIRPHVMKSYPLDEYGEALKAIKGGHVYGKILLKIGKD